MSGIGFGELIILLVIGLIVLGPERLPRVANQLGGWLGQARRMTRVLKRQLEDELDIEKDFDIVPPARTKHASLGFETPSSSAAGTAEKDDTWSPAHDDASPGTGVNVEPPAAEAEPTSTREQAKAAPANDKQADKKESV